MTTLNLSEAKASLGRLLNEVKKGKKFTIAQRNKPIAILTSVESTGQPERKLKIGVLKGYFTVPDDFDNSVSEFEDVFYGTQNE